MINADFTLHWIELAVIATSSPLTRPIKPSLFIYSRRSRCTQTRSSKLEFQLTFHLKAVKDTNRLFTGREKKDAGFFPTRRAKFSHPVMNSSVCVNRCTAKELNSIRL